ncbi:hypothetical protein CFC21_022538 [Triticum aestivum]|uniref:Uncharacterized protein n=3 Tax=Triticum TaxID=4564 RepID=A0A9R1EC16_WHEAT|nr:uncharacterized protein LOC119363030 [Triticum dicoccoides]XP_044322888.1 uncharacterized protein LOC123044259 [Triticum aestivum]KAF7007611.1 hypothetical protein CFC21_022536 [Triticum aestivum]KAF7007613.1 hypothetical protein CFC21_022538 [Triticum aestivum]VAH43948.1 unnamed protein product [Triticum turgidum subsp. durum]
MNARDLLFSGVDIVKQQASAVASTVSLAKPYLPAKLTEMNTGNIVAGLGYVKNHTGAAVASTVSLAKPYLPARLTGMNTGDIVAGLGYVKNHTGAAMVSTVSLAKPYLPAKLSTRDGAVGTAAMVIGGAVGAYFLWPAAAAPAAAGAMMKAPGAAGFLISRTAFLANPQVYYQILRTAGAAAAAAAFV